MITGIWFTPGRTFAHVWFSPGCMFGLAQGEGGEVRAEPPYRLPKNKLRAHPPPRGWGGGWGGWGGVGKYNNCKAHPD